MAKLFLLAIRCFNTFSWIHAIFLASSGYVNFFSEDLRTRTLEDDSQIALFESYWNHDVNPVS